MKKITNTPEKTDFGPGKTALYYNNVGLFSDPFLEDRLPNLDKYYNKASTHFLNDFWNPIQKSDVQKFEEAFKLIHDLWTEKDENVSKYCQNEAQLEEHWIKPIFKILGWTYEVQDKIEKRGKKQWPDYSLFESSDALKKAKNSSPAHKFYQATSVADAKAWNISLDGKGLTNTNPSFQIVNYMELTKKNWGILTNGKYWRIYSLRSDSKHTTFFEIDLEKILASQDYNRFKYFYNFFRKEAFVNDARLSDRSFLDFVFEDGQFYSQRVEKSLESRAYKVVDTICKGFMNNNQTPTEDELKETYEYSMYYLFKLMFVLNCESKGLLEVNKQDDYYEFSLRKICLEIKEQSQQGKNWSNQSRTYNYIRDLFELLKFGDDRIGVHGFGEEPFEVGGTEFFARNNISDAYLNQALLELSCDTDEDGNLQFIDYKILSPDHLGSLFEGLLEFDLVKKGKQVELLNTKGERKASGSYYTPDYLVDYIVEETLSPLVQNKKPFEILKLKTIDFSMGSGHFLLGAVKYLENVIIKIQESGPDKDAIEFDKIRKQVLRNCIFGVDINPLACQLAKFSLWIYTSQKGDSLEPLQDQLITKNALLDSVDWESDFNGQIKMGELDAILGNPPYIGEKGNKEIFHLVKMNSLGKKYYLGKMDYFYFFFHRSLDLLKKSGRAGLVSTNYYGTATGAKKLRDDLFTRATITKVINFNELKIFKGAQGQHNQVTFFSKGKDSAAVCEYLSAEDKGFCNKEILQKILDSGATKLTNDTLYYGEDNILSFSSVTKESSSIFDKLMTDSKLMSEVCHVKTGIMGGCDSVTNSNIKYSSESAIKKYQIEVGEGVFVLDKKDDSNSLKEIGKSKFLRPFFKNSDIDKFVTSNESSKLIIFSSKESRATDDAKVHKHLSRFKTILEGIRKINNESVDLWDVLRRGAQNEVFFESDLKIVAPQRSKTNTFGLAHGPWYASADVYYIIPKDNKLDIKFLLGLLNSKVFYFWLFNKGKRKGMSLELYNDPLSEIPVPQFSQETQKLIAKATAECIAKPLDLNRFDILNSLIYRAYKFSEKEINEIESLYSENHQDKKVA